MAQQTINIGTVANDGTGDTLRTAGSKINDNFSELYNGIIFSNTETLTSSGAADPDIPYTICNSGSPLAISLADASATGQIKIFTNTGAGISTITPASFAPGTTVALDQYDAVTLIWDGTNWYITGHYGATVA